MADVMTTPWTDGWLVRPSARFWRCPSPSTAARAFHASLPGYAVTALVEVPALAGRWAVGAVLVKNESSRVGLSAFKVLAHRGPWPGWSVKARDWTWRTFDWMGSAPWPDRHR